MSTECYHKNAMGSFWDLALLFTYSEVTIATTVIGLDYLTLSVGQFGKIELLVLTLMSIDGVVNAASGCWIRNHGYEMDSSIYVIHFLYGCIHSSVQSIPDVGFLL